LLGQQRGGTAISHKGKENVITFPSDPKEDFFKRERGLLFSSKLWQNKIPIPFFELRRKNEQKCSGGCVPGAPSDTCSSFSHRSGPF